MELWLSITDAAARLSAAGDPIDRSTLSRYLKQHADALPTRRDGKRHLVEFGALAQHRAENVRIAASNRGLGPDAGANSGMPVPARAERNPAHRGWQPGRFAGTQADGVARKALADAEMREMDLARRRSELTPTAEVDQAARDAVALMQSAFERAVETESATLSVRYGLEERIWRIALKAFARAGLDAFNREIRELLDRRADPATGLEAGPAAGTGIGSIPPLQ